MKQLQRILAVTGLALVALAGSSAARAEVIVPGHTVYLSSPGTNTVAGITYNDEDVIRYSPTANSKWAMHFDGSAAGLPGAADIDAYDYSVNAATFTSWHYMSFDRPITVPGLGKVDDSDIVLYRKNLLGNSWSLFFDGSNFGLSTDAEDIDALDIYKNGIVHISTMGGFNVPALNGAFFKGSDEDMLTWNPNFNPGTFSGFWDGDKSGFPAENDLHNFANVEQFDSMLNGFKYYYFFGVQKAGTVKGIAAGNNDVVVQRMYQGIPDQSLFWDASDSGFLKVDAFDVMLK